MYPNAVRRNANPVVGVVTVRLLSRVLTRQYHVVAESNAPAVTVYDGVVNQPEVMLIDANVGSTLISNWYPVVTLHHGCGSITDSTERVGVSRSVTPLSGGEGCEIAAGGKFVSYVVTSVAKNAFFVFVVDSLPLNPTAPYDNPFANHARTKPVTSIDA